MESHPSNGGEKTAELLQRDESGTGLGFPRGSLFIVSEFLGSDKLAQLVEERIESSIKAYQEMIQIVWTDCSMSQTGNPQGGTQSQKDWKNAPKPNSLATQMRDVVAQEHIQIGSGARAVLELS
ncbi:hypothetical protein L2E82_23016 [Cichorium intybus]|uniref:Uncharacterized protein n=1 Tax=Cichorium intybus TaxID=13427 RepID=A0ACB9DZE4_CICIN|nr:hypothetical protein L2E82_23016 [Cichorium intybus]